jgi:hypothetical protein
VGFGSGKKPQGEVGSLTEVRCYPTKPGEAYLIINYEGAQYTGCLLFDNEVFCEQLSKMLQGYCGMDILDIGSLDLPPAVETASASRKVSADGRGVSAAMVSNGPRKARTTLSGFLDLCYTRCKTAVGVGKKIVGSVKNDESHVPRAAMTARQSNVSDH